MKTLQHTELRFMRWLRKNEFNVSTRFLQICTEMGSHRGWTSISLCVIVIFDVSFGCSIGISALFGGCCTQIIKRIVRRERPYLHPDSPPVLTHVPDPWSFPSGHTASAFSVTGMLGWIGHDWLGPCTCVAIIVGFSRVYLGAHYPSDVIFGAMLGILCGCFFGFIW